MSTRANIVITDNDSTLYFYRHSDGYPEGTMPSLDAFLEMVKSGRIRDNAGQAAGWLILIGAGEYGVLQKMADGTDVKTDGYSWKCGAYEPTDNLHGDTEHLYVINLVSKRIEHLDKYGPDAADLKSLIEKSYG